MAASKYQFNLIDSTTRREQIQLREAEAIRRHEVKREPRFRSGREELPVIQMGIHHLLYRLENFRTLGDQLSQVAAGKVESGLFDPVRREDLSAQAAQHELLFALARKGSGDSIIPIYDELQRVKKQTDELIISADGVVVNGNRRLAAMRELFATGKPEFAEFQNVSCSVLPQSATEDEIVALEIELQMQPDTKLPYDWTAVALAARSLKNRGQSDQAIATMMNRSVEEIQRLLTMIDGADLYLAEHLRLPQAYNELDDTEQAFKQVAVKNLAKSDNAALREVTRKFDFLLIEHRGSITERAYQLINNIEGNADVFLDNIAAQWGVDLTAPPSSTDAQLAISFDDPAPVGGQKDYGALATYIEELGDDKATRADAARAVEEASVLAGEQGKKKDQAALKFAKAAQQKLAAINLQYAGEATFPELRGVLAVCIAHCESLMAKIDERLAGG
jgi:hypothetical protein